MDRKHDQDDNCSQGIYQRKTNKSPLLYCSDKFMEFYRTTTCTMHNYTLGCALFFKCITAGDGKGLISCYVPYKVVHNAKLRMCDQSSVAEQLRWSGGRLT